MNQNRDFDSEPGQTYICAKCGLKFKMKFRESGLCLPCRGNVHIEIEQKLINYFDELRKNNIRYKENYKKLKT